MKQSLRSWLWRVTSPRGGRRDRLPYRDADSRARRARGRSEDRARDGARAARRRQPAQAHLCGPWQKARSRDATDAMARGVESRRDVGVSATEGVAGLTRSPRSRWRSGSAPTARSLRLPTRRSCGRCHFPSQIASLHCPRSGRGEVVEPSTLLILSSGRSARAASRQSPLLSRAQVPSMATMAL